ncbi:helix-turn-helix domain-containing protein [Halorussus salinisoli]|uniref:helix-turn-helix domain-containing protein n=1 Tax=Halorussus salinisoli TaxID=2558242 RepID=UPI0010C23503|nr:helix-turn-helix domain-containing protein [Halorussus salinisoli]
MPQAKLTVTLPEETWMYSLSKAHPDATFRVVATLAGEGTGVALVELVTADPVPVVTDIERQDDADIALLWKHDDEALLQIETADPLLLAPVWQAGVPLRTPFEIRDGRTTWETTTTDERLSAFGEALADLDVEFDVEYVRGVESGPADTLLTDRQLEVLRAAADHGYYERPRTATLTEVAESLGVSKATASDVLQRAEGKIIDWFLGEYAVEGH